MIKNFDDLKFYISADLRNAGHKMSIKNWIMDPVLRFTIILRLLEYCKNTGKHSIFTIPVLFWFRMLSIKIGYTVGPNIFGPGVAFVHYGLLIIDPTAKIGKNCRIHMGVHIGPAAVFVDPARASEYSPRIGDNVYIAPGAKIYGAIRIGSNCTIGANSVVNKSFDEDGLLIAGVPARVISRNETGSRAAKPSDESLI